MHCRPEEQSYIASDSFAPTGPLALSYDAALEFLFPRTTTIKFGLETTRALLAEVGHPETVYPTIHIGGTNGKGSVSTLVASALREMGLRVGLYTSPHLVSFRERMLVDGAPISEGAVAAWTERLQPLILERNATFFEVTTAIALADFAARGVDIAVVEVGLGGRLDSTNVLRPLVSAVTRIALDHTRYLGDTLELIAREKAGIAKRGVPFVIGETEPALITAMREVAGSAGARIGVLPAAYTWRGPLGLEGPFQRRNAAVAHGVLQALPERYRPDAPSIARGFGAARIPGRFDRRGKWIFDVAHNPDGMAALREALTESRAPRPIHALVSILGDKDWPEMLARLEGSVDGGVLTVAPTAAGRRWEMAGLDAWVDDAARRPAGARWTVIPDFSQAIREVQRGAATVLVTGSFHTVGDAMAALGMEP